MIYKQAFNSEINFEWNSITKPFIKINDIDQPLQISNKNNSDEDFPPQIGDDEPTPKRSKTMKKKKKKISVNNVHAISGPKFIEPDDQKPTERM